MVTVHQSSKWILFVLLTFGFFFLFHIRNPFLREVVLRFDGVAQDSVPSLVQWDSGHGFNELEKKIVQREQIDKSVTLPLYSISSIRFEWSVTSKDLAFIPELQACWENECEQIPHLVSSWDDNSLTVAIRDSDRAIYSPRLVAIQFLLALFIAFMLTCLAENIFIICQTGGFWNFCAAFLNSRQGRFFSISFVFTFPIFLSWQLAYWPGSMTQLSYIAWDRTRTLQFDHTTAWFYQIFLVGMNQIYDSPISATLLCAVLYSLLACLVCSYSIKNGGIWISSLCLILFFVFPNITAWSTVLWCDIPYSILVVACACFLFWLFFEQRYFFRIYKPSNAALVMLVIFFTTLILLRRNGVLFLFLIPPLLIYLKLIEKRRRYCFIVLSVLTYLTLELGVTHALKIEQATSRLMTPELLSQIQWKMNPLFSLFVRKEGYVSDDYEGDKRIIEKLLPLTLIRKHYSPDSIETTFWRSYRYLAPDDIAAINSLYYRRLLPNFRILLDERFHMFFNNMKSFFFVNRLEEPYGPPLAYYPNCWNLRFESRWPWFHERTQVFLNHATTSRVMQVLILNPLFAMTILSLIVICYRWVPAAALYSFVVLFQIPFLFIVLPGAESRYFYFVQIGALLAAPLVYLELTTSRRATVIPQLPPAHTAVDNGTILSAGEA